MTPLQRAVVAIHGAFVVVLFVCAAWIALVLGVNDPDDDWMISARMVFWPIAGMVAVIACGTALTTYWWARGASRVGLFVADMIVPVLALGLMGPLIVDPSGWGEFPGLVAVAAFALICGGVVAAVKPPVPEAPAAKLTR